MADARADHSGVEYREEKPQMLEVRVGGEVKGETRIGPEERLEERGGERTV